MHWPIERLSDAVAAQELYATAEKWIHAAFHVARAWLENGPPVTPGKRPAHPNLEIPFAEALQLAAPPSCQRRRLREWRVLAIGGGVTRLTKEK
jgi:hypothetical protein